MRLFNTTVTPEGKQLVNESLESTFISAGKMADKFEEELKNQLTSAVKLAEANTRISLQEELSKKDKELTASTSKECSSSPTKSCCKSKEK